MNSIGSPLKQDSCAIIMTALDLVDCLSQRDLFSQDHALRCIATGVLADEEVNVDKCKVEVGDKVLSSMVGKNAHDDSFRKTDPSSYPYVQEECEVK